MTVTRASLLAAAHSLCDDFAAKSDVGTLLSHFSTTHTCVAIEHGEPVLAPFLGRSFNGLNGIKDYFTLLQKHLSYQDMSFSEFFADAEASKVGVKGKAKFTWLGTGESWDETFTYVLDYDHECKVTNYQVWADSGAAYLASRGELDRARK